MAAPRRMGPSLALAAVVLLASLGGCASLADHAVPPCEHCGDAHVDVHEDGTRHAVHRFRAVDWMSPAVLLQSARSVPPARDPDAASAGSEFHDRPMGK